MEQQKIVEILLVEDNPTDVELTMRVLEKNNISKNVFTVSDGEEALDLIYARGKYCKWSKNLQLKLILLDLKLPKINGHEVLKVIKSDPEKKIIPVVMMSSSAEKKDIIRSYELGVNSYIVKPISYSKFDNTVKYVSHYWMELNK